MLCHGSVEETLEHHFFYCTSASARLFAIGIVYEENAMVHLSGFDDRQDITGLPGTMFGGLRRRLNSMVNAKTAIYTH